MASKRPHASSSSKTKFDTKKFVSQAASKRFEDILVKKSFIPERGLSPKPGLDGDMFVQIEVRKWFDFVGHPKAAVTSVVREFYANAAEPKESKVFVRGKWVSFSREAINAYYKLPNIDDDEYSIYRNTNVDLEEVKNELCKPGTEWVVRQGKKTTLSCRNLNRYNKAWLNFIGGKLLPVTHFSDITVDRAVLLYAIVTGKSIDVGQVIHHSILHSIRPSTTGGLGHPSLIFALCQAARVPWSPNEELYQPKGLINHEAMAGFQSWTDGDAPLVPPRGGPAPTRQPLSASDQPLTIEERIGRMEDALQAQRQSLDQFMQYQISFNTSLATMFSTAPFNTGPHAVQFPEPPIFQNPQQEDPMEEEEEDD